MTFLEAYDNLLNDPNLAKRMTVAVYAAAAEVFTEATTTPEHALRLAWATRALSGDGLIERRLMNYLSVHPNAETIISSDGNLLGFVAALVTPLAKLPG